MWSKQSLNHKNDIAIYAIHTNLDNVLQGVNSAIAEKLKLKNCKILQPKAGQLQKLAVFLYPKPMQIRFLMHFLKRGPVIKPVF